jgi:hypothetical protein
VRDSVKITPSVREARLKAEYAEQYPGLTPDVWIPATELAQKLIERAHSRRREGRHTRTFDPTHFEFRGGLETTRRRGSHTRKTDPPRQTGEPPTSVQHPPAP